MASESPTTAGPSNDPSDNPPAFPDLGGETPVWARRRNSDSTAESPWARKLILSLDGGGVRGYASLLILQEIMKRVKKLERTTALYPHERSDTPTKVDSKGSGKCESSAAYAWNKGAQEPEELETDIKDTFRPHHYFDYFVGTSTGGLSAIMLGRLQMTVDDALQQYNTVCTKVFQRRRKVAIKATWKGRLVPRYNDKHMEEALQMVTQRDRRDLKPRPDTGNAAFRHNTKAGAERRSKNVRLANGNPYAAKTAVLTFGGHEVKELRMFRSYHHRTPNTTNNSESDPDGAPMPSKTPLKPLPACNLPLWRVGRATTAAPTYFKPAQIGPEQYWDGGVQGANNPVEFAYNEVREMHVRHLPLLIISIGTGIPPQRDQSGKKRKFKKFMGNFRNVMQMNDEFKKAILNSEAVHLKFKAKLGEENKRTRKSARVKYHRFNVPEEFDITGTKLGDWHGLDGAYTTEKLRRSVEQYVAQTHVEEKLDKCAEILVSIRRQRQCTERWERFALHLVYNCPEVDDDDGECEEPELESRLELRQHLIREHGYVWQVPCRGPDGEIVFKFTCFWDDCGEQHVSGFKTEAQFIDHLIKEHNIQHPRVVQSKDFEAKLDEGRKIKPPSVSPHQTFDAPRATQTGFSNYSLTKTGTGM